MKNALGKQLVVCLLAVVVINALIKFHARLLQPHPLLARIDREAGRADTFIVGDSTLYNGFDSEAFSSARPAAKWARRPINIALWQTSALEHLIFLRRALQHVDKADLIIYPTLDRHLTEVHANDYAFRFNNRALSYYADPDLAHDLGLQNDRDYTLMKIFRWVPMIVERGQIHAELNSYRTLIQNFGLPPDAHSRGWRNNIDPPEYFRKRYDHDTDLSPAVVELFRTAKAKGARVLVVGVPVMKTHRDRYYSLPEWDDYFGTVKKALAAAAIDYLDTSDWMPDDLFQDEIHLPEHSEAARLYSARLAHAVDEIYANVGK